MLAYNSSLCLIQDLRIQGLLVDTILETENIDYMARIIGNIDYFDEELNEKVMDKLLNEASPAQLALAVVYVGKISNWETQLVTCLLEKGKVDDFISSLEGFHSSFDKDGMRIMDAILEDPNGFDAYVDRLKKEEAGSLMYLVLLCNLSLHIPIFC
jgi:hypothetical protein